MEDSTVRMYLFQCNPNGGEGNHLEDVELQEPPEKLLDLRQDVREPSGQDQQPVCHQSPLTGPQSLCWSGRGRTKETHVKFICMNPFERHVEISCNYGKAHCIENVYKYLEMIYTSHAFIIIQITYIYIYIWIRRQNSRDLI